MQRVPCSPAVRRPPPLLAAGGAAWPRPRSFVRGARQRRRSACNKGSGAEAAAATAAAAAEGEEEGEKGEEAHVMAAPSPGTGGEVRGFSSLGGQGERWRQRPPARRGRPRGERVGRARRGGGPGRAGGGYR